MGKIKIYILFFFVLLIFDFPLISQGDFNKIMNINIGIATNLFPESDFRETKAAIETWSKELTKDGYLDYYLVVLTFKTNDDIIKAFDENNISIAAMHALDYLYIKNKSGIIPLLIPSIKANVTEDYIILTNKKSNIKNIAQLRNKNIAIQSVDTSMVSFLWFDNLVMMKESTLIENFCHLTEVRKENKAIFSVFFDQKDACVVSSKVYYEMCKQNSQLKDNLIIIENSPPFIRDIFCISKNLEKKYVGNLLDATFSMQSYESGKKIMNIFQFERFTIFEEKFIQSLETLLSDNKQYHNKLKSKAKNHNKLKSNAKTKK